MARQRRSNEELEASIISALEKIIEEKGFTHLPVTSLISAAKIDPNAFYRRFNGMEALYETIAKKYDFWLNDSIDMSELSKYSDEEYLVKILTDLHKKLSSDKMMQKVLLWELSEENETTKHTAALRDILNQSLLSYYRNSLKESGLDTNAIFAIIIAGIYYLMLHRGIASFCDINFTSEDGARRLDNAIKQIIHLLYMNNESVAKTNLYEGEVPSDATQR